MMDENCLDIYWWLRVRVVELFILEHIIGYADPCWPDCPVLFFFADGDAIPRALFIDHGLQDLLIDDADRDADPWGDLAQQQLEPLQPRAPVDYEAEFAALMEWLDSDDSDDGAVLGR